MSPEYPAVTVLMSVHNGERFLREAVTSILAQTYGDFEFLILDDASSDATPAILASCTDARIRIVTNPTNLGLTRSLDRGLDLAHGRYVARLDADDASEPERLARQVAFLDAHPEITVAGTWTVEVDEHGTVIGGEEVFPAADFVRWQMTHTNAIYHSTVMMRRDAIRTLGGYDERFRYAQDHDLWARVIMAGGQVSLVPEKLTRYRRTRDQLSSSRVVEQWRLGFEIRRRYCEWLLGRATSVEQVKGMMWLLGWPLEEYPDDLAPALRLVQDVRRRCAASADRQSRQMINRIVRERLLERSYELSYERPRQSALMLRHAAGVGIGGLTEPWLWKQAVRLALFMGREKLRELRLHAV